jgi:hypothetical protein
MMKFPPKNYKIEHFSENIKSIETKDMHPNIALNNILETPVIGVQCQDNESTQIDAENMLQLLSSVKKSKHCVIELDITPSKEPKTKNAQTQYSPLNIVIPKHKSKEEQTRLSPLRVK